MSFPLKLCPRVIENEYLNATKGFLMYKVSRENFRIFKTIFTFIIVINGYLKEQSLNAEDFDKARSSDQLLQN